MSFAEAWITLSTRINSLRKAGELYARFQSVHAEDQFGAGKYLVSECHDVVSALETFRHDFAGFLPPEAIKYIDAFLSKSVAESVRDSHADHRAARACLVALVAVESTLNFILAGREEQLRMRSERAFMLLNRMIAVDNDVRTKWQQARDKNEMACERLGSVHLLSQGIYAFKVDALGARTDLVFREPPDTSFLLRAIDGLVLTEWKAATHQDFKHKYSEARNQAERYTGSALAGVELTSYRYLVVVSKKELPAVDDVIAGSVVYRHINVVVDPVVPSVAARHSKKHID